MPRRKSILTDTLATQLFHSDLYIGAAAAQAQCRMPTLRAKWVELFGEEAVEARKLANWSACKSGDNNPMKGKTGDQHHSFKGRISDGKGYILIMKPDWFTGRKGSKHIFEHHAVYCQANGLTEVPEGMVIHHKNGIKTDNRPENLEMLSNSDHMTLHHGVSPRREYNRQLNAQRKKNRSTTIP